MKFRPTVGSVAFDVFNHCLLALLMVTMIYPFIYIVSVSVSDYEAIAVGAVKLFPKGVNVETYRVLLKAQDIPRAFLNSVIYTVLGTVWTLFIASLTAYGLEQPGLPLRKSIIFFFVLTMFVPGGMIPNFLLIKSIGFYNTMWALVVPCAFGMWNILIIRSNIRASVPRELLDAARIDGASEWRIYFTIVLPLIKPILATIALFVAVNRWNDFFGPLIYLNKSQMFPLPIILRKILLDDQMETYYQDLKGWGFPNATSRTGVGFFEALKMSAIVVAVFPIVAVYPFVQKYFVKGVLVGSLKG